MLRRLVAGLLRRSAKGTISTDRIDRRGGKLGFAITLAVAGFLWLAVPLANTSQAFDPVTDEQRILDYTNRQRTQAGLAPLKIWPAAAAVARSHSEEMARAGSLFHSADWERVDRIWVSAAQNIGLTYGVFGDAGVQTVQCGAPTACNPLPPVPPCPWTQGAPPGSEGRSFLTSKPHCENIMNPAFNFVGIGIVYGADGAMWVTVDFYSVPNPPAGLGFPPPAPQSESPIVPLPSKFDGRATRYFAEGYTGTGFDTLYVLFNYSNTDARVNIVFYLSDGSRQIEISIPPGATKIIDVSEYVGRGREVGAKVTSDVPIAVHREMRFNYRLSGIDGSTHSVGLDSPKTLFLLPEGYTGPGFEQWLTLANPSPATAQVLVTFMKPDGSQVFVRLEVPSGTRRTLEVAPIVGPTEISTKVESTNGVPVLVERPMYFSYNSLSGAGPISGGHIGAGIPVPETHFYLAEGYTGPGFEEWITIQNPNTSRAANVRLRYLLDTGSAVERSFVVGPHSRFTRFVNGDVGGHSVAVELFSDIPIAVERPMYFDYRGWRDGHNGQGLSRASKLWAAAGIDTRLFIDTWITVGNPNPAPATVTLYFYDGSRYPFVRNVEVPANGRGSFKANDIAPQGKVMGLLLASTQPVALEIPVYHWIPCATGGDVSPGVPLG
jgi:hypothetical protein